MSFETDNKPQSAVLLGGTPLGDLTGDAYFSMFGRISAKAGLDFGS
ncbi:unnamed protein product [Brugia timori]|uniref:Uncharacterized protein n=1 Tax=Brugia timori TaxID=42155 RepID=A0A3P7WGH8_9BILA|nr:unnamed protein product [Brugia timori]